MTTFALTDATTWVNGYDFTTDLNQIQLNVTADELDTTTFGGGGYRSRIAGLKTVGATLNGYWQSAADAAVDPQAFGDLGVADRVVTIAPDDGAGTPCYLFQGGKFNYELFGAVGEVTPFTLGVTGTNGVGVVRGMVAQPKATVDSTGATGSVVELGAVGSTQYLYASLHVFSVGTTITVQVQSDDNSGFTSATTQGTFSGITTVGGTWLTRVAGPITDTYWRFNVSAITGSFSIAGAIGIG